MLFMKFFYTFMLYLNHLFISFYCLIMTFYFDLQSTLHFYVALHPCGQNASYDNFQCHV